MPRASPALAKRLDGVPIDVLINNAGIGDRDDTSVLATDFAMFERTLAVNTLGPLRVTQALLPNLRAGSRKHIVNMSSRLGSITLNNGNYPAYRASKAALNQVNRSLSIESGRASSWWSCTRAGSDRDGRRRSPAPPRRERARPGIPTTAASTTISAKNSPGNASRIPAPAPPS